MDSPSRSAALDQAYQAASRMLTAGVRDKVFPGASAAMGWCGERVLVQAGRLTYDPDSPAIRPRTLFDCASLTKVVTTTTVAMMLVERGLLHLDAQIGDCLPEFLDADDALAEERKNVTARHLLAHTSGLPAYVRFYLRARRPEHVLAEAMTLPLECPPGAKTVYSDVGFILLGEVIARSAERAASDAPKYMLDRFCARELFRPLGMADTMFNPPLVRKDAIAPTERDDAFRHRLVQGEVHDENAWVMGGVAPHAGLFSIAEDLANFCQFMLNQGSWNGQQLIQPQTIREFTRYSAAQEGSPRGLGWDKPSAPSSSGKYFSPASYGHLGFTGTSMWIDPEKQLYVVLLTNRIYPTRANEAIREFRPAFHDAVLEALRINN